MASFVPDARSRIVVLLEQRIQWVEHQLSLGPEPPLDIKSKLHKEVSDRVNVLVQQAPVRVKRMVNSAFSSVGWDAQRGAAIVTSISMAKLVGALKELVGTLNNYNLEPVEPTRGELGDIRAAAARLWELDHNRLVPGTDFQLDIQGEKSPSDHRDVADRPLFKFVDQSHLDKPTFKAFLKLLDNYNADEGKAEVVTPEEAAENEFFLNLCMDTAPLQYVHKWLAANRKAPADRESFLRSLNTAWFGLYRRKVPNDSSGFEHVFLGEREEGKVVGLHNWLQIRSEEIAGRLNYKGKIRARRRPPDGFPTEQLMTIQFEWEGVEKFISTSFVGTSPEFEIALYSLCFFSGEQATPVQLGPHKVLVKAFKIDQRGGPFIGSSFPEEMDHDEDDRNKAARVIQKPVISRRGR